MESNMDITVCPVAHVSKVAWKCTARHISSSYFNLWMGFEITPIWNSVYAKQQKK